MSVKVTKNEINGIINFMKNESSDTRPGIIVTRASSDKTYVNIDGGTFMVNSDYMDTLIEAYNSRTKKLIVSSRRLIEYVNPDDLLDGPLRNDGFFQFHDLYLEKYQPLCNFPEITSRSRNRGKATVKTYIYASDEDFKISHAFKLESIDYAKIFLGENTNFFIGDDPSTTEVGYLYAVSERGRGYIHSLKL